MHCLQSIRENTKKTDMVLKNDFNNILSPLLKLLKQMLTCSAL